MSEKLIFNFAENPLLFERLYEEYCKDNKSVDSSWKSVFSNVLEEKKEASLGNITCGTMRIEFTHQTQEWLQRALEEKSLSSVFTEKEKLELCLQLSRAELFEVFLHTKYVGQKRFSLEGAETLIPMLTTIIEKSADEGARDFVIGMPHRGRLNVLVNVLHKSYAMVFSEFEDDVNKMYFESSGDVKYHKGFSSDIMLRSSHKVHIALAPNASHVESVDPIVEGKVHAKQVKKDDREQNQVIPILVHGDAAICGQGIVYETMQLQKLPGYGNGGTIHIIINNKIGFTTIPKDYMSTSYCTDIAKTFDVPVFHVNVEDPEQCLLVSSLAVQLRNQFHTDVFIDLNCYRKYGHNESDDPSFTQPLEYRSIKLKKSIRHLYVQKLLREQSVQEDLVKALEREYSSRLQKELEFIKETKIENQDVPKAHSEDLFEKVNTSVSKSILQEVAYKLSSIPQNFHLHKKIVKLMENRLQMIEERQGIDWAMAEQLAFATLLLEKKHVRLSGQDSQRGTFSQRHCVWVDQDKEDECYIPLNHLKEDQGLFSVYNSPLSEFAILGFEYGYSLSYLEGLVIWEAQYGDFSNEAQVIIDQYIAAGKQKWEKSSNITLFLPHGYEGQGPEHSSGRMERFLQLAGDGNMQIINPTTPAQFFHLLRKQVYKKRSSPLIVFTPKGLLRYEKCKSLLLELSSGKFEEILDDLEKYRSAKILLFCSGRVFYDLILERENRCRSDIAIIRIEQLYPLHEENLKSIISTYQQIEEVFWVQEEPQNMGAWSFMQPRLQQLLNTKHKFGYRGRKEAAVSAVGSHALHLQEYESIMSKVFE
ncbi:MAG: 2-oxoglutarate dehydrogenase E1 component [Chlamydiales bacterium]|nr:2-oxoglutarate dehydrogenase E1 component [Chlamydiales bacterium]